MQLRRITVSHPIILIISLNAIGKNPVTIGLLYAGPVILDADAWSSDAQCSAPRGQTVVQRVLRLFQISS